MKGVVGDVRLAEVLVAPFAAPGKAVVSCDGSWFIKLAGFDGLCMMESAI